MENFADSFQGKLYLLLIDKVIVGAVIAIAFFAYDRYKTLESQNLQKAREQVQLEFEKSRLIKEFLPVIQDQSIDLITRAYVLRSSVLTGSLDPDAAFELGQDFLRAGLEGYHYKGIISATIPGSLSSISRRGNSIANEWHSQLGSFPRLDTIFDPVSGQENLPAVNAALITEARLIRDTLYDAFPSFNSCKCPELTIDEEIPAHLFGLFVLLQPRDIDQAVELSKMDGKALRILGMTFRYWKRSGGDQEAQRYLEKEFLAATSSESGIRRARVLTAIIKWISAKEDGFGSDAFAEMLGRVAVGTLLPGSLEIQEESDIYWLRWQAAEAIYLMGDNASDAQPSIAEYLGTFYVHLERARNSRDLESISQRYQAGKILRVLVSSAGEHDLSSTREILSQILAQGEDKLRHFPFLLEDIERALVNGQINGEEVKGEPPT